MKIGLLVIGSEVLNGKTSDANTRILAEFLKIHHLEILESITVRDDEAAIQKGLSILFQSCHVIITSGGLGPTKDDITKQTIAAFLGRSISYSPEAHEVAQKNYQKFERPFQGKEHGYCYLPDGFVALNNSTGLAPNLSTKQGDKILICGPGVPREFKSMLKDHFLNLTAEKRDQNSFLETVLIRTKKIPEEKIFGEVDPTLWERLSTIGEVSSLPVVFGVDIGVKIRAKSEKELKEKRDSTLEVFKSSPISSAIWHVGQESLEEVIVALANRKKVRFGFAESATGGLCSNLITNVPGASRSFHGSVICYDEKVKMKALGVKQETLKNHSAESFEVAFEMALGLLQNFALDIAVSITGVAGPSGGTNEKPVGTVFIGSSVRGVTQSHHYKFFGDREQLKNRFAQAALHTLLEELEKLA